MNGSLWLTPLVSALCGWLLGFIAVRRLFYPVVPVNFLGWKIQGLIPQHRTKISRLIAQIAAKECSGPADIQALTGDPTGFNGMFPVIETHIDEFLRHKLGKAMPMIGMFIGDKTIADLKTIFMKELEEIFPDVMKTYLENLIDEQRLADIIFRKLTEPADQRVVDIIRGISGKLSCRINLYASLAGFFIGIIQLALTILMLNF